MNSPSLSSHGSHHEEVPLRKRRQATGAAREIWKERRVFKLALFCTLGGFIYGYNIGIFGGILVMNNFKRSFPLFDESSMRGLVSAMLNLGAWLGTIQNGWASERLGRRRSITLACFFSLLGAALQTGARNPAFFFVGRFFTGFGVGALSTGAPLYNSEISPSRIRGSIGSLFQLAVEFGTLLAFWIDFGTNYIGGTGDSQSDASWRIPAALQILPILILAIGILFTPESPRWLIAKSRDEEALRELASLRRLPEDSDEVQKEYLEILGEQRFESEIEAEAVKGLENKKTTGVVAAVQRAWTQWSFLLRTAANRKRVFVGVMVMFFQQWNGINAILFYAPQIFQGLGLSGTTVSLLATGVVGVVMLIATIPTVLYLDRIGRKPALIGGAIVMGICHAVIAGLSGRYQDSWSENVAAGWVACVFVWIFTAAFAMTFGPVAWVLIAEIFPLRARSKGLSIAAASSWLNAFIVSMATPSMLDNLRYGTYIFFAGWCFVGAIFCCFIPETSGHSLEEMNVAFGETSKTSEEDKLRMDRINREIGYDKYQAAATGEKATMS